MRMLGIITIQIPLKMLTCLTEDWRVNWRVNKLIKSDCIHKLHVTFPSALQQDSHLRFFSRLRLHELTL